MAEIYTLNIDGKILLVIEVFRGNLLPYYLKKEGKLNGTYIRVGATNRKAGPDNILDLERQKRNISFDEEINYDIEFSTLDLSSLYNIFEKSQNFILNHINLRAEIKDLQRTDTYEIPFVAIREALLNALIHRDYSNLGRDIKIVFMMIL